MAIRLNALGGTDWENGEVLDADDLIDTMRRAYSKTLFVYEGNAFDSYADNNNTVTNEYEFEKIPSGDLDGREYLEINVIGTLSAGGWNSMGGTTTLNIYTKPFGGSYSLRQSFSVNRFGDNNTNGNNNSSTGSMPYLHKLTGDELSQGIVIKIESVSTQSSGSGSGSASTTNKQTIITLK